MLDNDYLDFPNLVDPTRLMKKKANIRQNRIETQKESNLPYSIAECWAIVDAVEKDGYNMLAELILLDICTGCRMIELYSFKLEDVGPDYFQI